MNIKRKIRNFMIRARNLDILVGDKVLLNNETGHKLDLKYTGPYKVTEI